LGKQNEADRIKYSSEVVPKEPQEYYSEIYSHGTPCDITGNPRTTEVRYYCHKEKISSTITDIKEPSSCSYIFTVSTTLLCNHPLFAPKKEVALPIYCIAEGEIKEPLDIMDQFETKENPSNVQETTDKYLHIEGKSDQKTIEAIEQIFTEFLKQNLEMIHQPNEDVKEKLIERKNQVIDKTSSELIEEKDDEENEEEEEEENMKESSNKNGKDL